MQGSGWRPATTSRSASSRPGDPGDARRGNREDLAVYEHVLQEIYPKQKAEYGIGLDTDVAWFRRRNQGITQRRMYATPRYATYVAKWRWGYHPWVERQRRRAASVAS